MRTASSAGVLRVADGDGRDRDAGRHLHDREQRVEPVELLERHRHADHRERGHRCGHPGQVGRTACAGDDHPQPAVDGRDRVFHHPLGRAVGRDDAHLERDRELLEHVDRGLHHRQVGVAAHDDADERSALSHLMTLACRPCDQVPGGAAMQTRLTELLEIEHPVMLAGMGGVSYHALVGAVSEAGGFGCLGASTMQPGEIVTEIRAVRQRTAKPFGVDLLTALPAEMMTNVENLIREGASVFVAGLGVPRDAVELCHEHGVLVANMCGKVRHALDGRRGRVRLRDRAGNRGRWPHGDGRDDAARAADRRRGRRSGPGRRGRWDLRRPRPRGRARARRRRRVDRHPLHRDPRGAGRPGLQGRPAPDGRGRHRRQPGVHGQDAPRRAQRADARTSRSIRRSCTPSPSSSSPR